jgi:HK97 family phage major capsid protein
MPTILELQDKLITKSKELDEVFVEAGPDYDFTKVKRIDGDTAAKVAEVQRRQKEINDIGEELDQLQKLDDAATKNRKRLEDMAQPVNRPVFSGGGPVQQPAKGLRELLGEHKGYEAFRQGKAATAVLELPYADYKTLITLTTINVQNTRQPGVVEMALEERTVSDMMLQGNTNGNTVEYYEETTVTNNAAAVAEGGTKPESALGFTLRTESVRKIAHWIPATKEALDDVPFLESQIRGRLAFGIRRSEETQVLTGSGVAPIILGLLNRTGIQTQAKGADPTPDAIFKAMQKVRGSAGAGFAEPSGVVLHPNDWTDIRLLRTADGLYIWGNPSDPGPERIWGKEVRQTTGMTENTGLVGAFRPYAEVLRREGITITVSTEHSTYFVENKIAILAEERLALAVYRPSAFATVTGI